MYRARRSVYLRNRFQRANVIAPPHAIECAMQIRNFSNINSTLRMASRMPDLIQPQKHRPPPVVPKGSGNAWLKDPGDRTLSWRNMVSDMQIKPIAEIERACNSTSRYAQIKEIYNQISENNACNMADLKKDDNAEKQISNKEIKKIKDELPAAISSADIKRKNMIPSKLTSSFSEVLKGNAAVINKFEVKESASASATATATPTLAPSTSELIPAKSSSKSVTKSAKAAAASGKAKALATEAPTTSVSSSTMGNRKSAKNRGIENNKKKGPKVYLLDGIATGGEPMSIETCMNNIMSHNFGDFDVIKEESHSSQSKQTRRRQKYHQPYGQEEKQAAATLSAKTNAGVSTISPSSTPISSPLPLTLPAQTEASSSGTKRSGDNHRQLSLAEDLRQRITMLKEIGLSVNQIYILDLMEDVLERHEPKDKRKQQQQQQQLRQQQYHYHHHQTTKAKRSGFEDENARILHPLGKRLKISNALVMDAPSPSRIVGAPEPPPRSIVIPELHSPLTNMLIVDPASSTTSQQQQQKKKRKRKRKNVENLQTQTIEQLLRNGERVKAEIELEPNQTLYEIKEIRAKSDIKEEETSGCGKGKSIYFVKEIRVMENDHFDRLGKEIIRCNGGGAIDGGITRPISGEANVRIDRILRTSRPVAARDRPEDMAIWLDNFSSTHLRDFTEEEEIRLEATAQKQEQEKKQEKQQPVEQRTLVVNSGAADAAVVPPPPPQPERSKVIEKQDKKPQRERSRSSAAAGHIIAKRPKKNKKKKRTKKTVPRS